MRKSLHKKLTSGKWSELSLIKQLANIGSEVSRARKWQGKDEKIFRGAVERALELFDLTLEDQRWRGRLREIARTREIFCDTFFGGKEYRNSFKDLEQRIQQKIERVQTERENINRTSTIINIMNTQSTSVTQEAKDVKSAIEKYDEHARR